MTLYTDVENHKDLEHTHTHTLFMTSQMLVRGGARSSISRFTEWRITSIIFIGDEY